MRILAAVLLLAALFSSCSNDNSSRVSFELDSSGCLIKASDFDSESRYVNSEGIISETYVWECADYTNTAQDIDVQEKKVTLLFEGRGSCLTLTTSMIGDGYCVAGKAPLL